MRSPSWGSLLGRYPIDPIYNQGNSRDQMVFRYIRRTGAVRYGAQDSPDERVGNGTIWSQLIAPVSVDRRVFGVKPSINRSAGTRNVENAFRIRLPFPLFAATAAHRARFGSKWRSSGRSRLDGVGRRTAAAAT